MAHHFVQLCGPIVAPAPRQLILRTLMKSWRALHLGDAGSHLSALSVS
jgi:hypothetical protein